MVCTDSNFPQVDDFTQLLRAVDESHLVEWATIILKKALSSSCIIQDHIALAESIIPESDENVLLRFLIKYHHIECVRSICHKIYSIKIEDFGQVITSPRDTWPEDVRFAILQYSLDSCNSDIFKYATKHLVTPSMADKVDCMMIENDNIGLFNAYCRGRAINLNLILMCFEKVKPRMLEIIHQCRNVANSSSDVLPSVVVAQETAIVHNLKLMVLEKKQFLPAVMWMPTKGLFNCELNKASVGMCFGHYPADVIHHYDTFSRESLNTFLNCSAACGFANVFDTVLGTFDQEMLDYQVALILSDVFDAEKKYPEVGVVAQKHNLFSQAPGIKSTSTA